MKRVRLRGTRSKSKEPTYREWAVEHLRPLFENFLEAGAGDLENTERLHQFRIAGKKLRYATELLSGAFDSRLRDVTYEFLETLQDKLGTINDHASALTRISNWNDENGNEERHRYLAEMRCDEQKQLDLARQHFTEWWSVEQQTKTRAAFQETLNAVSDLK